MESTNEIKIIIDDKEVSLEEFQTIKRDPKVMLKEISRNMYKTLQRLYG